MTDLPAAGVFVVGSVNQDYLVAVGKRPGPGETVTGATLTLHPGGKGANQAVAAARSGAVVGLLGRVGDDGAGRALLAALADDVDVGSVAVTPGVSTGSAFVTVTPDGENTIVVAPGANLELSADDVEAVRPAIESARVLVAQLEIRVEPVLRAAQLAARAGTKVVLNLAPAREVPAELLAATDVLVVNEHEAAFLLGTEVTAGTADLAADALRRLGPRTAVITLGRHGAVLADGSVERVPAPQVPVVDTTGAGDAFVGALAARLAAGAPLVDAVGAGVLAGSRAVQRPGAQSSFSGA